MPAFTDWAPIVATGIVAPSIAGTVAVIIHRPRLGHERRLKNDEINRAALDDAATAASVAIRDAPDVVRTAMLAEEDAADRELLWWDLVSGGLAMQARMQLRLGEEHPACTAYDDVLAALLSLGQDIQALRLQGDQHDAINARGLAGADECARAYARFIDTAAKIASTY